MGYATNGVKSALWISLLHGFLFLIADSETETTLEASTNHNVPEEFIGDFLQDFDEGSYAPYFDPTVERNITGLINRKVELVCRVRNLHNRTVSWVRHRDIHLLTVGRYTYTSDQRFEAMHQPGSEEWVLTIRSPQPRDSGQYECQISTTPPVGFAVFLNIVAPQTTITSGPDLYIQKGSTINLTCVVEHTREPPQSITWSHGSQVINFDSARGGISLVTEKGVRSTSRLLIQRATSADAGIYLCQPNDAFDTPNATIRVHVLSGELPAAMQQGCARSFLEKVTAILCCVLLRIPLNNQLIGT